MMPLWNKGGWDTSDFNDISWINATEILAVGNLSSQISMPLKVKKQLEVSVSEKLIQAFIFMTLDRMLLP